MSEAHRPKPRSLRRIVLAGVARAPRRAKLALAANVVLIVGMSALILMGLDEASALRDVAALMLFMSGAMLMSFATVLWTLAQDGGKCGFFDLKREALLFAVEIGMPRGFTHTRKLDEVLVAFPVLALISSWLMSAGVVIWMITKDSIWARAVLAVMGLWFLAWTVSMVTSTSRFMYGHAREQAEAAERARGDATEAQLTALQAQMNPHFLFNTLNTVASLVRTDPVAAEATVENLAVVLRRTLDRSRRVLSTVDDEIDHLAAYLSVAKERFEDRLQVHWSVDPQARPLLLPTMTLQPLVENAIKHGVGARLEGGTLHIGVHLKASSVAEGRPDRGREDGPGAEARRVRASATAIEPAAGPDGAGGAGHARLVIEVADDGPGFRPRHREGTGLGNLRTRLATLYGDRAGLSIDGAAAPTAGRGSTRPPLRTGASGARVVVTLPVVRSPAELLGEAAAPATPTDAAEPRREAVAPEAR